jgi:hypothetical protein
MATIILEVPHPHRFVCRARDDTGAIIGKCKRRDRASVAIQRLQLRACRGIPHPHRLRVYLSNVNDSIKNTEECFGRGAVKTWLNPLQQLLEAMPQ